MSRSLLPVAVLALAAACTAKLDVKKHAASRPGESAPPLPDTEIETLKRYVETLNRQAEAGIVTLRKDDAFQLSAYVDPDIPGRIVVDVKVPDDWASSGAGLAVYASSDKECRVPLRMAHGLSATRYELRDLPTGAYFACALSQVGQIVYQADSGDAPVAVNRKAPEAFTILTPLRYVTKDPMVVAWTPSEGATSYLTSLHDRAGCSSPVWQGTAKGRTDLEAPGIAEGMYRLCVQAANDDQNLAVASNNDIEVVVDRTPPDAFALTTSGSPYTTGSFDLTWAAAPGATGYAVVLASDVGCAMAVRMGQTTVNKLSVSGLPEGTYRLCVKAFDAAGNETRASNDAKPVAVSFPPTATLNGTPTGTSSAWDWTANVGGAGVATYRYKVGAAGDVDCADGKGYGAERAVASAISDSVLGFPDGAVRLCVIGVKADGVTQSFASAATANWVKATNVYPSFTLTNPPVWGPRLASGGFVGFSGTASTPLTTAALVEVSVQQGGLPNGCLGDAFSAFDQACAHWLPVSTANAWSLTVDQTAFAANTYHWVSGRVTDALGRASPANARKSTFWEPDLDYFWTDASPMTMSTAQVMNDAQFDASGNLYLVGQREEGVSGGSGRDWWLRKFGADGREDVTAWNKVVDGGGDDAATAVALAPDGSVYVGGSGFNLVNPTSANDWWIKKFTAAGVEVTAGWDKKFNANANSPSDTVTGLAVDASNNVIAFGHGNYLTGPSSGTPSAIPYIDWWIKKFNAAGTQLWEKKIDGNGGVNGHDDLAARVAVDASGNIFVVGSKSTQGATYDIDWWVMKLDSSGNVLWEKTIDWAGGPARAQAVTVDAGGNAYVAGYGTKLVSPTSAADWWIKKYSPTGVELLDIKRDGNGSADMATAIALDATGRIYVGGTGVNLVASDSGNDWWIKRFLADGSDDPTFEVTYDARRGQDYLNAMAMAPDGSGIVAVGRAQNAVTARSQDDAVVKKYSLAGVEDTTRWRRVDDFTSGAPWNDHVILYAAATDSAGYVYTVGCTRMGDGDADWFLRKLSPSGVEVTSGWPKVIDGNHGEDCATAVAVDAYDDSVYVGGYATNIYSSASAIDLWLRKFASDGSEVPGWDKRIDAGSGAKGKVSSLMVQADGSLFMAGYGMGLAGTWSGEDWLIKKFARDGTEDKANWNKVVDGGAFFSFFEHPATVLQDGAGNIYVGGIGTNVVGGSSGADWWIKRYGPTGVAGYQIKADPGMDMCGMVITGSVLVVFGQGNNLVNGSSGTDWMIRGYNLADGSANASWTINYDNGGKEDRCGGITVDETGGVFFVGSSNNQRANGSGLDVFIKRYTAAAAEDLSWRKSYDANSSMDYVLGAHYAAGRLHVLGMMTDAASVNPPSGANAFHMILRK